MCRPALVIAHNRRPTAASITVGVAALMKLTAWPLLLALPATYHSGPKRWRVPLIVGALLLPAALWSPRDFTEDNFLYPLGLGDGGTTSHAPTVGFFVVKDITGGPLALGRALLTIALLAVATGFGLWLLRRRRLREPDVETRNRKPLKQPIAFGADWELRLGPDNRFRVFYQIDAERRQVRILAVGVK